MFWRSSRPTGSSMAVSLCSATKRATPSMSSGMVTSVIRLLSAVSVTESATSPRASIVKTFDELPPGEQATSMSPMKRTGSRRKSTPTPKAMSGSATSCPSRPATTPLGRCSRAANELRSSSRPSWNINTSSIGRTIQTVFMAERF